MFLFGTLHPIIFSNITGAVYPSRVASYQLSCGHPLCGCLKRKDFFYITIQTKDQVLSYREKKRDTNEPTLNLPRNCKIYVLYFLHKHSRVYIDAYWCIIWNSDMRHSQRTAGTEWVICIKAITLEYLWGAQLGHFSEWSNMWKIFILL